MNFLPTWKWVRFFSTFNSANKSRHRVWLCASGAELVPRGACLDCFIYGPIWPKAQPRDLPWPGVQFNQQWQRRRGFVRWNRTSASSAGAKRTAHVDGFGKLVTNASFVPTTTRTTLALLGGWQPAPKELCAMRYADDSMNGRVREGENEKEVERDIARGRRMELGDYNELIYTCHLSHSGVLFFCFCCSLHKKWREKCPNTRESHVSKTRYKSLCPSLYGSIHGVILRGFVNRMKSQGHAGTKRLSWDKWQV